MPFGDRNFDFGVNLAWLNHANGWDLGHSPYYGSGWGPYYDQVRGTHDIVDTYFRDIAAKGFKVVRIWVFEKLEGLILDPARFDGSQRDNLNSDADRSRYNVPDVVRLDSALERNAVAVMERAAAHGLEIYWCLLSVGNVHKNPERYHSWAVSYLVNDSVMVDHFVERALTPFLDAIRPYSSAVYAIDLMNEPEGIESGIGDQASIFLNLGGWDFSTEWEYYFQEASRIVREKGFKCSIGFRNRNSITDNVARLSPFVDFFDFHEYNNNGDLDPYESSDFDGKPCIIGECGYNTFGGSSTQTGVEQRDTLRSFMRNALNESDRPHGYAGILPWYYNPTGGNDLNLLDSRNFNLCFSESVRSPPTMIPPPPARTLTLQERYEGLYAFLEDLRRQPNHYWRSVDDGGNTPREEIEDFARRVAIVNGAGP